MRADTAISGPLPVSSFTSLGGSSRDLWLIVGGFTLLRLVLAAWVPLLPEEAYYWTWSQYPDWSYFDHPPLASFAIGAATAVLGNSAFAVKVSALTWSFGCNVLWMQLLQAAYRDARRTAWTLLALNLTLVYEAIGVCATPDGPLLFCWTGAVWSLTRLAATKRGHWWYAFGVFAGFACLSKYTGVLLFVVAGAFVLAAPAQRHWLRRFQPYVGTLIAAALCSPIVIWNLQHHWASLAFQSTRRFAEMDSFRPQYLLALFAVQFMVVTPYLFATAAAAVVASLRKLRAHTLSDIDLALLLSGLVPLALFVTVSVASNAKVQWLAPAWWSLICLGIGHALTNAGTSRLSGGFATSVLLLAGGLAWVLVPGLPMPPRANTWGGWQAVSARVDRLEQDLRKQGVDTFIFTPDYRGSSMIWFYRSVRERTYAQDILGEKALQYDYFPRGRPRVGSTGLFVTSARSRGEFDEARLRRHFRTVEAVDPVTVGNIGQGEPGFEIWRCTGYLGPHP